MLKKSLLFAAMLLLAAALAAGCSSDNGNDHANPDDPVAPGVPEVPTDPVTLLVASHFGTDADFMRLYIEPVKQKYPHLTLDVIPGNSVELLDQYLVAGNIPDVHLTFNGNLNEFNKRDYIEDMTPLISKFNVDLGRFKDNYLNDIRHAVLGQEAMYGLPVESTFHALYYNIDIFDKFGVDYPRDGMAWDDAIELARRVTRRDGDVLYRGFDPNTILRVAQPLGLEFVDPVTEKAIVNNDQWRRVFELGKQILSIPGNEPSASSSGNGITGFFTTKTIAMFSDVNQFSRLADAMQSGLNWDVAQHPYYPDQPNVFGNASVYLPLVTKASRHKDQAMLVVQTWISDEVQMSLSRAARVSTLDNEEVQSSFGLDNPLLDGKNVASIVKSRPVQYPVYLYRAASERIIRAKFDLYLKNEVDVVTALRQAEEEINLAVEAENRQ